MKRQILLIGYAVFFGQLTVQSLAQMAWSEPDRDPASSQYRRDEEDEEYGFSWLDPDKRVYVLQNRKYRKAQRFAAFLSGGINLTNPYRTEYLGMPRLAYWFSEQFGVEAFYASITNSDNSNLTALKNASPTALPFVREHRSYFGSVVTWTPWYSKLNFFNKILYYDWFFDAGLGQVSTAFDQNRKAGNAPNFLFEDLFAIYYGTGMNFYASRNVMIRLDLMGMAYSATGADNQSKRTTTNYDFSIGLGYIF